MIGYHTTPLIIILSVFNLLSISFCFVGKTYLNTIIQSLLIVTTIHVYMVSFGDNFRDPITRIGRFSWLILTALIVETLIVVKFGWDIITIPIPKFAVIGWSVFFVAVSVWAFWKFSYPFKEWPIIRVFFTENRKKKD